MLGTHHSISLFHHPSHSLLPFQEVQVCCCLIRDDLDAEFNDLFYWGNICDPWIRWQLLNYLWERANSYGSFTFTARIQSDKPVGNLLLNLCLLLHKRVYGVRLGLQLHSFWPPFLRWVGDRLSYRAFLASQDSPAIRAISEAPRGTRGPLQVARHPPRWCRYQ